MPPIKRSYFHLKNEDFNEEPENELPSKLALLDIAEEESNNEETANSPESTLDNNSMSTPRTRLLRNRRISIDSQKCTRKNFKRRCYTTPRRRPSDSSSMDSLDISSLDDLCMFRPLPKKLNQPLETIHEEPHLYNGSLSYVGPLKVRRILFTGITKSKTKKRKAKIKKLANKISKIRKIPFDDFIKKLHSLDEESEDPNQMIS